MKIGSPPTSQKNHSNHIIKLSDFSIELEHTNLIRSYYCIEQNLQNQMDKQQNNNYITAFFSTPALVLFSYYSLIVIYVQKMNKGVHIFCIPLFFHILVV